MKHLKSWLPTGGTNLFQLIKEWRAEAEAAGIKIINLAIGQPSGPAFLSAREACAKAVMSSDESMHEYQDNGSPGVSNFAKLFIEAHGIKITDNMALLPIPGIKPMLILIPLACGALLSGNEDLMVATTTKPGYPTPEYWCTRLGIKHHALETNPANGFLPTVDSIPSETKLLSINYPKNPTGTIADQNWWESICAFCAEKGIRIFNDAAYFMLRHDDRCRALSQVAPSFPGLSWVEAFSASKEIGNGTGWRVGAMCGTPDFIGDIAKEKGNLDSGFFAPAAAGALHAVQNDQVSINESRTIYAKRIEVLKDVLLEGGMKLACEPGAGFFILWQTPKEAFGQPIADSEAFNKAMIQNTGVVAVHFGPYYRTAVVDKALDDPATIKAIIEAVKKANPSY